MIDHIRCMPWATPIFYRYLERVLLDTLYISSFLLILGRFLQLRNGNTYLFKGVLVSLRSKHLCLPTLSVIGCFNRKLVDEMFFRSPASQQERVENNFSYEVLFSVWNACSILVHTLLLYKVVKQGKTLDLDF